MQPTQSADTPTVVLFDELGAASVVAVPPQTANDLYGFLKQFTGCAQLEPWTFVLSCEGTTLLMSLYCNEVGLYENSMNLVISQVLGVELRGFGKVVLVCMEEFEVDEDREGKWSTVVSAETLQRKIAERWESLLVYEDKSLRCRVGDLMHEMRNMIAKSRLSYRSGSIELNKLQPNHARIGMSYYVELIDIIFTDVEGVD